jgi:N-acyl-D-amino-acid deacylase
VLFPNRDFADRAEAELVVKEIWRARSADHALRAQSGVCGQSLAQIAAMRGSDAADALMAIIKEGEAHGATAGVIATSMDEARHRGGSCAAVHQHLH